MSSRQQTPPLSEQLEILNRLKVDSVRGWGSMRPEEMLRHCSDFIRFTLGEKKASQSTRLIGKLFGWLIYAYVIRKNPWNFPKNMQTFPEIKQRPGRTLDFNTEKATLAAAILRAIQLENKVHHPIYGQLSADKARQLVQLHTAYHLRQFSLF
ncbi:MAG: DUF1569 domain-containing protein [Bacteroidia bacterium]